MEVEGLGNSEQYLAAYPAPSPFSSKAVERLHKPSPLSQSTSRGSENDRPTRTASFSNSGGQQGVSRQKPEPALGGKDRMHRVLLLGWKTLVDVYCNGLTGKFIGGHERDLYIQCTGPGYDHLPLTALEESGCIMTCSQFEKKAGRELSKKWKESIHVVGEGEGSKATLIAWLKRRAAEQFGEAVVGKECWVCWCADGDFYRGTIIGYSSESGKHKVRYSDRFVEELHLPAELLDFGEDKPRVPSLKESNFKLPSTRQNPPQAATAWSYNVSPGANGQIAPPLPGSAQKSKGMADRGTPKKLAAMQMKSDSPLPPARKQSGPMRADDDLSPMRPRSQAENGGQGTNGSRGTSVQRTASDEDPYRRPRPVVTGSRRRSRAAPDQGDEDEASDGTASDENMNITPRKVARSGDVSTPGRNRASGTPSQSQHMHQAMADLRHASPMPPGPGPAMASRAGTPMDKRMAQHGDLRRTNGNDVVAMLANQQQPVMHDRLHMLLSALGDAGWQDALAPPAPPSVLPAPPSRGYEESNPVVISKWMNDMILELEDVLEGYQPDDEDGGPRMSARFQMLLVQSRNTDQFRGFYDAMLARYQKHQANPDLLQSKLAEFIVGCLHQYDVMAQAQANVAQAAAAGGKPGGK